MSKEARLMRGVLTVKEKKYLSPHYIRINLEGDDLPNFRNAKKGENNKIVIPKDKAVPLNLSGLSSGIGMEEVHIRTYTMRDLDLEKKEMTIDFVAHGESGPASTWAIYAQPGDQLGVLMKQREKQLYLAADWYLFAGDHTALPVISVMLESLPYSAKGKAIIEVYSEEDVINMSRPPGIDIQWIFNSSPGKKSILAGYLKNLELPADTSRFVFAAAEQSAIHDIQDFLKNSALHKSEWQTYSYWKFTEDKNG